MKNEAKRQLRAAYEKRSVLGGVYAITNTVTGKMLVEATPSLASVRNRFEFAQTSGLTVWPKLQKDWNKYGSGSFAFEVLEELEKGETQSAREFATDLKLLKEMWLNRGRSSGFY